jgi:hypothetical protein
LRNKNKSISVTKLAVKAARLQMNKNISENQILEKRILGF